MTVTAKDRSASTPSGKVKLPCHCHQPVYKGYFADPFVWTAGGCYYAVGTGRHRAGKAGRSAGRPDVFLVLRSQNLADWEELGPALVSPDPALGTDFWAPEIACENGRHYMYYSVGFGDKSHHLRIAVSDSPCGPYADSGIALLTLDDCPFAIDAHPFRDDDGQWYLFYARDFPERDGSGEAGTAIVMDRLEGMTRLAGEERIVMRPRHNWQLFQRNRPMCGRVLDWHTIEGPAVLRHDGRCYCFYSGGCWQNETYGVDYAMADNVTGPYSDAGGENGPRVLWTIPGLLTGPGHNSFCAGPDGASMWIAYHAWDPGFTARRMHLSRVIWMPRGPVCASMENSSRSS
ncbi:MAG: glycoside hydrolase family 43 protein [Candidatus Sumerlaeota bacterium]|nr:glycoside hydrolase family 43 protein [Candidatus Sumerlaeota bacterium]